MVKPFKTLDEQIEYLEKNKNIVFDNKEEAKKFLLENNYFNVISSTKIFFCTDYNQKHLYSATNFSEWMSYYKNDQNLSFIVFRYVALIEKKINSKLAYYVSKMIDDGVFTEKESQIIEKTIKNSLRTNSKLPAYDFSNTWVYVTNFTFGGTCALLKKVKYIMKQRQKNKENFRILSNVITDVESIDTKLNIKKDIHYLLELRNCAGHNIPLNVFIMSGRTKNERQKRISILKSVALESDSRIEIQKFINKLEAAATKYIEIRG